jgi:NADH dehydrogenase FAD-containing subunit
VSIHIKRFVDRLRGFESRNAKDFSMSITDAKDLHADITRILNELQECKESIANKNKQDEVLEVKIVGGGFKTDK